MEADFLRHEAKTAEFDQRFSKHPLIRVTYEQLCNDQDRHLSALQDFLGIPRLPISPGTKQRHPIPMREWITNYQSLKDHFAETQWGRLFEE